MASPRFSPNEQHLPPAPPSNNMQGDFTHSLAGYLPMASPPSAPTARPLPSASPSNNVQRHATPNHTFMTPFDFNPPKPPTPASTSVSRPPAPPMASFSFDYSKPLTQQPASANFSLPSAASVAFSGDKRRLTVEPFKSAYCGGYILHQDPAFRRDVQEFFGHTYLGGEPTTGYYNQNDMPPVYKAADDDLAVWRAGRGAEGGVEDGGGEGDMEDRMKSTEDASREALLEKLRYKLISDSP